MTEELSYTYEEIDFEPPVDEGEYEVEVISAEMTEAESGRMGVSLFFRAEGVEGRFPGDTIWLPSEELDAGQTWGQTNRPKFGAFLERVYQTVNKFGFGFDKDNDFIPSEFCKEVVGSRVRVKVEHETTHYETGEELDQPRAVVSRYYRA